VQLFKHCWEAQLFKHRWEVQLLALEFALAAAAVFVFKLLSSQL
jgi:hypothetical protein